MAKQKTETQLQVADGAGELTPVQDLRFDTGYWPVRLRIPSKLADEWMAQLHAECELRGYHSHGLSQPDVDEASGTTTIRLANGAEVPAYDLIWEKPRDKALVIQARPAGGPAPSIPDLRRFLTDVTRAMRSKRRVLKHKRAYLVTSGRPWSGDLWLTSTLCLGPPSKPAPYMSDPQIIVVDAMVEGIGSRGVTDSFQRLVRELLIFLDVVIGTHAVEQRDRRVWTYEVEDSRYKSFELRSGAYYEPELYPQMPIAGARQAMPIQNVTRPGIKGALNLAQMDVQVAPQDAASLWQQLQLLKPELQRQFLEAGNAYRNAQSFWPDQRTAFASFLVVSCEALKPARRRFDGANIYDVINSLRDQAAAEGLRTLAQHPQSIRSDHFHRGKLAHDELAPRFGSSYFDDPTFDELLRTLDNNSRICLIEWLRLGGNYTFRWLTRARPAWRTRLRKVMDALRGVR